MNSDYFPQVPVDRVGAFEMDDPIGQATLHRMASVDRYNRWIYDEIVPFAGRRLLEVGCGIGNMTDFFLNLEEVVGLDPLPSSVHNVKVKYARHPNVHIYQGDITTGETVEKLIAHHFDTIVCLNVLEHIEKDQLALRHMYDLLVPGGRLLLFVPAGQYMYGSLDVALGHFCRYEKRDLDAKVREAGFDIIKSTYMNLAGIPGWWLNSRVLQREILPTGQLQLFNTLAPIFIAFEHTLRKIWDAPIGQSVLCIGKKGNS